MATDFSYFIKKAIRFPTPTNTPAVSVCSEPCQPGEAKQYYANDKCCWQCFKCINYFVSHFILVSMETENYFV